VRRRETALPQAIERAMDTEGTEEARESKEEPLAAGKDENEKPIGREALEAGSSSLSWRGEMLEDVVKADHVECQLVGKVPGKEAGYHRESVAPCLCCDVWIRLQAGREIAAPGGGLQEPTVRAAHVEEPGGPRRANWLERVQYEFEVAMPETVEGLSATGLVD
jgi:hypothetical protein